MLSKLTIRAGARLATAVAALVPTLAVTDARAQVVVPVPNVTLDRTHMELSGKVDAVLPGSFAVNNRAACGVNFTKERASVVGLKVDCPRWELGAHESMTCDLTATRSSPGTLIDRFLLMARVAEDCKTVPLAQVDARERNELRPLLEEEERHRREAPSEDQLRERLKELEAKYDDKTFDSRKEALEAAANAEKAMLAEVWADAQRRQQERLAHQRLKVEMIETDKSAFEVLDGRIAAKRREAQADIDAHASRRLDGCDKIDDLRKEKEEVLADLRRGEWHSKCGLTASQILKQKGQTLRVHLDKEGGTMVPPDQAVIRKREEEFDRQIDYAQAACRKLQDQERTAKGRWPAEVRALEAKRPELERAKQASIERARTTLALLDEQGRKAVMTQRARVEAVERKLEADVEALSHEHDRRKADLAAATKALRAAHEKAEQQHSEKLRALMDKIARLRTELAILVGKIRGAHEKTQHLGVRIDATFHE